MIYAERWGWTPDQVDEIPLHLEPWLLPIAYALDEDKVNKMPKAKKRAGH